MGTAMETAVYLHSLNHIRSEKIRWFLFFST